MESSSTPITHTNSSGESKVASSDLKYTKGKYSESKPELLYLYEDEKVRELFKGLKVAECNKFTVSPPEESTTITLPLSLEQLTVSDLMSCSCCEITFRTRDDQVHHFRSDVHKYNIKRQLTAQPTLSLQQFQKLQLTDDVANVPASDPEHCSDNDTTPQKETQVIESAVTERESKRGKSFENEMRLNQLKRHSRLFIVNASRQMFSIYKCLVMTKKTSVGDAQIELAVKQLPRSLKLAIFMISGGHFAAAVFNGGDVVVHKTFHSYTVRAKQGGSQSSQDEKGRGNSKSAGASLRRYNQLSLTQHVQQLVADWEGEVSSCSLVFVRASGGSDAPLFAGRAPPLSRRDPRIRPVPFPTRRPTHVELLRVHQELMQVHVYGTDIDVDLSTIPSSPQRPTAAVEPSLRAARPPTSPRRQQLPATSCPASSASSPPDRRLTVRERRISLREEQVASLVRSLATDDEDEAAVDSDSASSEQLFEVRQLRSVADLKDYRLDGGPADATSMLAVEAQRRRRSKRNDIRTSQHLQLDVPAETTDSSPVSTLPDSARELLVACYTLCKTGDAIRLTSLLTPRSVEHTSDNPSISPDQSGAHMSSPDQSGEPVSGLDQADASVSGPDSNHCCSENRQDASSRKLTNDKAVLSGVANEKPALSGVTNQQRRDSDVGQLLDEGVGPQRLTLLHTAASSGHADVVRVLLELGSDPTIRDSSGRTAYDVSVCKPVRNQFRKYRAEYPNRHNYAKAHIAAPLTADLEAQQDVRGAEKKRLQNLRRRQRQKERSAELAARACAEQAVQLEIQQQQRFLALSDREKMALSAERRRCEQVVLDTGTRPVLQRCFCCGVDITGQVPFTYSQYRFCSTVCVRHHRANS